MFHFGCSPAVWLKGGYANQAPVFQPPEHWDTGSTIGSDVTGLAVIGACLAALIAFDIRCQLNPRPYVVAFLAYNATAQFGYPLGGRFNVAPKVLHQRRPLRSAANVSGSSMTALRSGSRDDATRDNRSTPCGPRFSDSATAQKPLQPESRAGSFMRDLAH
jgi:hypothetical protein